jgi:hypothetical protein
MGKREKKRVRVFCNRCHKVICEVEISLTAEQEEKEKKGKLNLAKNRGFMEKIKENNVGIWTYGTELGTYHRDCLEKEWKEFKEKTKTKSQKEVLQEMF